MNYWLGYILTLILGFGLIIGAMGWAHRFGKTSAWGRLVQNLALSGLTLFLVLMAAELFFKVFFAQSDGWNQTLASQNWFERYWTLNALGYRDTEWPPEAVRTKRKILILGDSFAAGQGIERIEDRFSNRLGVKLGEDYLVMNVATPGISTRDEIERVKGFPYKPEILILQYFVNDIRSAAHERGLVSDVPDLQPWPLLRPLIEHSYALNFIYWRGIRLMPRPWQADDFNWLDAAYNDPGVWWTHQQELATLYQGTVSENVKLIVVIFPSMLDVEGSRVYTGKVANFFRDRQVPVLDVTELLAGLPPDQLVVSAVDAHPNEWVHQQVAEALYPLVVDLESPAQAHEGP